MPAGQGKDAEQRFAAAVEQGTPPGAAGDAELARELEIVAMLRSRGAAYAPDPEAKARAKQRLMAVLAAEAGQSGPRHGGGSRPSAAAPTEAAEQTAPLGNALGSASAGHRDATDATAETTVIAPITARQEPTESTDIEPVVTEAPATRPVRSARPGRRARHSVANRPAGRARASRRPGAPSLRGRVAVVGTAALLMLVALASGGVFASRDALPGDNLYAIKRAAESAGLALTFDEDARARRNLEIAATRLSEVEQLVHRQQASPDPTVYSAAMQEFDSATDEGSNGLLAAAEADGDDKAAEDLHSWVTEQSSRLAELRPSLPATAGADGSIELLDQLRGRTEELGAGPCGSAGCDPKRVNQVGPDLLAPETDEDEDTSSPSSTDEESESSTPSDEADEDSDSSTETPESESPEEHPRLLPDLRPDEDKREDRDSGKGDSDEDSTSTRESDAPEGSKGGDDVAVPLPLLPPITLPPLLPGMPGITIG